MKQREDIQQELKSISRNFPLPGRHVAPEGYFTDLPDRVIHRWRKEPTGETARLFPLRSMVAAAAIFTGVCLGILWLTQYVRVESTPHTFSSAEAYTYILEHVEEFEPLLYEEMILPEDWLPAPVSPEEAEEFLLEEMPMIDIETLF